MKDLIALGYSVIVVIFSAYSCAFFGDILLQGYLYISQNWFCFYSKILGHEKLVSMLESKTRVTENILLQYLLPLS